MRRGPLGLVLSLALSACVDLTPPSELGHAADVAPSPSDGPGSGDPVDAALAPADGGSPGPKDAAGDAGKDGGGDAGKDGGGDAGKDDGLQGGAGADAGPDTRAPADGPMDGLLERDASPAPGPDAGPDLAPSVDTMPPGEPDTAPPDVAAPGCTPALLWEAEFSSDPTKSA